VQLPGNLGDGIFPATKIDADRICCFTNLMAALRITGIVGMYFTESELQ
jgi:hypothetical protein